MSTVEFDTISLKEELKYYRRDWAMVYFDKRKFLLRGDNSFEVTTASKFIRQ